MARHVMLLTARSSVEETMSQNSLISSHLLTPRWTHAIDVRAQSRREDMISFAAVGLTLLAVLRDQAVPLADLPRREPQRPQPSGLPKPPSPLHVPQEIESVQEHQTAGATTAATCSPDC